MGKVITIIFALVWGWGNSQAQYPITFDSVSSTAKYFFSNGASNTFYPVKVKSSATLTTPRTINGVSFNGSANITAYTYSVNVMALTSSPGDGVTTFFSYLPKTTVATSGQGGKIFVRQSCTIRIAEIYTYSGTAGTGEAWVFSIRKNNTADTQIASVSLATNERIFSNTGLSISMVAGDYFEIKMVNPTWATNPLTTIIGGYVMISVP